MLPLGKKPILPAVFFAGTFLAKRPPKSSILFRPEENS